MSLANADSNETTEKWVRLMICLAVDVGWVRGRMTAMLRRLIAVALVAGGIALPLCAQSGGAQAAFRGGPVRNGPGYGGRRSVYGTDRYRRPYLPAYGLGFGASGWWDMNYPEYFDSGLYDSPYDNSDSGYAAPAAAPADAAG